MGSVRGVRWRVLRVPMDGLSNRRDLQLTEPNVGDDNLLTIAILLMIIQLVIISIDL